MADIDFRTITTHAYLELIRQHSTTFPADPLLMKFDGILILSFQKYSALAGVPISSLTINGTFSDGYACRNLRPNLKLILYDEEAYEPRARHTFLHEVGHMRLEHTKHGSDEEVEAHFFASQVCAPNVLLREIVRRGHRITLSMLTSFFGISDKAAAKKMSYLQRFPETHKNEHDDLILQMFRGCINSRYPDKTRRHETEHDVLLESEREKWLYLR